MTLIVTYLDRNGIVLASDSNLTDGNRITRQANKNFEVPYLRGGLNVAGCYTVDGIPMDEWMPSFIDDQRTHESQSLERFADHLRLALDCGLNRHEKKVPTFVHLAGYAVESAVYHPEFYSIRNAYRVEPDGNYAGVSESFQASEDFWQRDCKCKSTQTGFLAPPNDYGYQFYINGFPVGRITYMIANQVIAEFLKVLFNVRSPGWNFRPPTAVSESASLVKMVMSIIHGVFELSDYSASVIGGEINLLRIAAPQVGGG
jgi:hypothetical protein